MSATHHCNDMLVAPDGSAYVGNFGFDLQSDGIEAARPADLARIRARSRALSAATMGTHSSLHAAMPLMNRPFPVAATV